MYENGKSYTQTKHLWRQNEIRSMFLLLQNEYRESRRLPLSRRHKEFKRIIEMFTTDEVLEKVRWLGSEEDHEFEENEAEEVELEDDFKNPKDEIDEESRRELAFRELMQMERDMNRADSTFYSHLEIAYSKIRNLASYLPFSSITSSNDKQTTGRGTWPNSINSTSTSSSPVSRNDMSLSFAPSTYRSSLSSSIKSSESSTFSCSSPSSTPKFHPMSLSNSFSDSFQRTESGLETSQSCPAFKVKNEDLCISTGNDFESTSDSDSNMAEAYAYLLNMKNSFDDLKCDNVISRHRKMKKLLKSSSKFCDESFL